MRLFSERPIDYIRKCVCVQCGLRKEVHVICKSALFDSVLPEGWSKLNRPGLIPGDYCSECSSRVLEAHKRIYG